MPRPSPTQPQTRQHRQQQYHQRRSCPALITITNNQCVPPVATAAPFDQEVIINPSAYSSYETPNLGDIRFYLTNSPAILQNELNSWCESGCTSSSTNAIFWVKIPSGIPACSSVTLNMTFNIGSGNYDGIHAGEAPQLSVTGTTNAVIPAPPVTFSSVSATGLGPHSGLTEQLLNSNDIPALGGFNLQTAPCPNNPSLWTCPYPVNVTELTLSSQYKTDFCVFAGGVGSDENSNARIIEDGLNQFLGVSINDAGSNNAVVSILNLANLWNNPTSNDNVCSVIFINGTEPPPNQNTPLGKNFPYKWGIAAAGIGISANAIVYNKPGNYASFTDNDVTNYANRGSPVTLNYQVKGPGEFAVITIGCSEGNCDNDIGFSPGSNCVKQQSVDADGSETAYIATCANPAVGTGSVTVSTNDDAYIWATSYVFTNSSSNVIEQSGYGQYDNGGQVFPFYDNFRGQSMNSSNWQLFTYGVYNYSFNNGFTINATKGNGGTEQIFSKRTFTGNIIVENLFSSWVTGSQQSPIGITPPTNGPVVWTTTTIIYGINSGGGTSNCNSAFVCFPTGGTGSPVSPGAPDVIPLTSSPKTQSHTSTGLDLAASSDAPHTPVTYYQKVLSIIPSVVRFIKRILPSSGYYYGIFPSPLSYGGSGYPQEVSTSTTTILAVPSGPIGGSIPYDIRTANPGLSAAQTPTALYSADEATAQTIDWSMNGAGIQEWAAQQGDVSAYFQQGYENGGILNQIWGLTYLPGGTNSWYINYKPVISSSQDSPQLLAMHIYLGAFTTDVSGNVKQTYTWVRTRAYPPNGVMPVETIAVPPVGISTNPSTTTVTTTTSVSTTTINCVTTPSQCIDGTSNQYFPQRAPPHSRPQQR